MRHRVKHTDRQNMRFLRGIGGYAMVPQVKLQNVRLSGKSEEKNSRLPSSGGKVTV